MDTYKPSSFQMFLVFKISILTVRLTLSAQPFFAHIIALHWKTCIFKDAKSVSENNQTNKLNRVPLICNKYQCNLHVLLIFLWEFYWIFIILD